MVQSKQKGKRGDIVALKGKTTFELTDVNTGEVEVIEDSNMITNGLQEFLRTYGYFGCDVLSDDTVRTNSLWVNALGGLFLFDSRLDENVENTFMPAGVKMIGNGSKDVANSGAVTELGSYNTSESGLQSDGSVKFVYDFSTQQANGSIACACLTSKIGGYMGMGNDSSRYINRSYNLNTYVSNNYCYSGITGAVSDESHILYPVYSENAIYFTNPYNINYSSSYASQHWSVTKKIQILKVRAGFTSVGIKDRRDLRNVVATYDVDIPQDILDYMGTSNNYTFISRDSERNVYIIFNKSSLDRLNAGAFCWIMKIDKDMNATAYKFTNNVGKELRLDNSRRITFDGDYLWTYTFNSPYVLYGIKYSDSTQIIETGANKNALYNLYTVGKNLIGIYDKYYTNNSYYAPTLYDVVNRTHRQVNGAISSDSHILVPFPDKKGVYLQVSRSSSQSSTPNNLYVMKDPRYLATINNLSEPVVKTASKTMKVTYTITEA